MRNQKKCRKFLESLPLIAGCVILVIVIIRAGINISQAAAPVNASTSSPSSVSQATMNICDEHYLPMITELPFDKAESLKSDYQNCLLALNSTEDPNARKPTLAVQPTGTNIDLRFRRIAGSGGLAFGAAVPPGMEITTSSWREIKAQKSIMVYAGSVYPGDSSGSILQGALEVMLFDMNSHPLSGGGIYPTPLKAGPVTIVDAQGEVLSLVADDGTIFNFDVSTQKYVPLPKGVSQNNMQHQVGNGTIIESNISAISGQKYKITNQWYQENNGQRLSAFVGYDQSSSDKGVLLISSSIGQPTAQTPIEVYPILEQNGPYRIVDAIDNQIVIVNRWGSLAIFDLSTRQFLSEQQISVRPTDAAVATYEAPLYAITPQPTVTLISTPERTLTPFPAYP